MDQDLGALLARVTRRVIDAERPVLEARGLSMWAYIAISRLAEQDAETQSALAHAMRYDKTRLIGLLDELEQEGLVTRTPDPADRRARIVTLTPAGLARHAAAKADIRAMETDLLGEIDPTDQLRLREVLAELAPDPGAAPKERNR
jgi:DNA-binding MarR family transcriptional regulator